MPGPASPAVLPDPPDDSERLLYTELRNRFLSAWQAVSWACLSASLLLFSLASPWLLPFVAWVVLGVVYFSLSFAGNTTYRRFDLASHDRGAEALRASGHQPSVDVLLPNCGEDLAVIDNTFRHVAALEWKGELTVLCLDDAGRPEVKALAESHGFRYLSRPDKPRFKKAGNLRHGYLNSDGDFLVVFDADFAPRPDFLSELVPHALSDDSVGIVQSPQYFNVRPGQNWLENGAGAVQEFFYRWVMPGRDSRRSPICVGTNAVYRRAALETTDGGALVESSEDVHTGFDLMAKGWRTRYVPVVLAKGLCPTTLETFFNQQHRWCSGSMSLLFSSKFWHSPIGLRPRLTFLTGMVYYLYTSLAVFITPLPAIVMVCFFPDRVFWWNYALVVPALLQTFVFLPRWHHAHYGFNTMRVKLVYSWAHLFAFRDRLVGQAQQWTPSGETAAKGSSPRMRTVKALLVGWPLLTWVAAVGGSAVHMDSALDPHFWPVIALATVYAAAATAVLLPLRTWSPMPQWAAHPGPAAGAVAGTPAVAMLSETNETLS